jgi:hypothetical protein
VTMLWKSRCCLTPIASSFDVDAACCLLPITSRPLLPVATMQWSKCCLQLYVE